MPTHRICAASMAFATAILCAINPEGAKTYLICTAGGLCALLVHWAMAKQLNANR